MTKARFALLLMLMTAACAHRQSLPPVTAAPVPDRPAAFPPPVNPGEPVYAKGDLLAASDRAFGKGAQGAARLIERAVADLGEPNGYIVGREAGGAIAVGLRYGSGTLYHRIEGEQPVWWTGPSLGFDLGGEGSRVFTLVYHLDDTAELFRRYPALEGHVYLIGGFGMTYHQRGRVILVPIRLGVGWRLGANLGYLKFTRRPTALPF